MNTKYKLKKLIQRKPLPKIAYRKLKRNNSYSEGENLTVKTKSSIMSDCEEKKEEIAKDIEENCYLKYDFYLYLTEKETEEKLKQLRSKLIHTKPIDIEKSYRKFHCDYDKMIDRFTKESCPQYIKNKQGMIFNNNTTINTTNSNKSKKIKSPLTVDEICQNLDIHNMQFPNRKLDKVYIQSEDKLPYITKNAKQETFYHNLQRNVDKFYPHFLIFNIKKMLSLYKNFDRKQLYQIFAIYKDLVSLCYATNKDELILKNGIDFATFWKCVNDISVEKKKFVEKLFMQINRNKSRLLTMNDFFEGMSFIQNTELKEKLDLFLKALDETGKGNLLYDEVKNICKDSIKRNLFDESQSNDEYALVELSEFFADFIFKLLNNPLDEPLKLEDIKNAIIQGSVETQYLEMFCGGNKVHGD